MCIGNLRSGTESSIYLRDRNIGALKDHTTMELFDIAMEQV
ncbi:MAG: hypothetical protein ACLRI8_11760 [Agathobacter rectalis]